MRLNVLIMAIVAVSFHNIMTNGQPPKDSIRKSSQSEGFAETVAGLTTKMHGEWRIDSARLHGAELPLQPFESLSVDAKGFTLVLQQREVRFEFKSFNIETRTFIAVGTSADHPKGLIYEVSLDEDKIKIRYRTDDAHQAPASGAHDDQLLVQIWKKKKS